LGPDTEKLALTTAGPPWNGGQLREAEICITNDVGVPPSQVILKGKEGRDAPPEPKAICLPAREASALLALVDKIVEGARRETISRQCVSPSTSRGGSSIFSQRTVS
jgi:hypothetical protein